MDEYKSPKKFDKIIPIGKQEFAYQSEDVSNVFKMRAWPPTGRGNLPYPNEEGKEILYYEFEIERHTSNSFTVSLRKIYRFGYHDCKSELFQTTMSFSQMMNQVFKNVEVSVYKDQ